MLSLRFALKFAIFLLPALLCLTACGTMSRSALKQRVAECRIEWRSEIPDAPAEIAEYVPFSVELLGVIEVDRKLDAEEWRCIDDL